MKAVILCGGYGTRLAPLTNKIPKVMIKLGGIPCLEHIINHLHTFGVNEIILDVHYKHQVIMDYFGDSVLYHYQKELLPEEETIESLGGWLNNEYAVVANGDTITDVSITGMMQLGRGKNIMYMDSKEKDVYAGTKILSPAYWSGDRHFLPYYSTAQWCDIGTWTGLRKARERFK